MKYNSLKSMRIDERYDVKRECLVLGGPKL